MKKNHNLSKSRNYALSNEDLEMVNRVSLAVKFPKSYKFVTWAHVFRCHFLGLLAGNNRQGSGTRA